MSEESTTEDTAKNQIIQLLEENERGVTEKTLQIAMSFVDIATRAKIINELLAENKIELLKQGSQLVYKLKGEERKICETDEENVVYAIIEEAGNRGIWMREIRNKSKLPQIQLNKVLKNMENKKLIKNVKSIAAYKKKVYMLYDVEPDVSVTGGTWYSNNYFETEFVEVLNQQCYKYLLRKSEASAHLGNPIERKHKSWAKSDEICDFIAKLGISKVDLTRGDIENILETLVYDGKVEKFVVTNPVTNTNFFTYRAIQQLNLPTALMRMPCGVCPVNDECHEAGIISPTTCVYLKEWFES